MAGVPGIFLALAVSHTLSITSTGFNVSVSKFIQWMGKVRTAFLAHLMAPKRKFQFYFLPGL